MKFGCIVLLIVCLAAMTIPASSSVYYVSKTGNDANSGLSWGQAWASTDKLNSTMVAGDTALFGTGRWLDSQIRPPLGSTSLTRTVYACSTFVDGGDGSDSWHRAMIVGGDSVTNWVPYDVSGGRNIWVGEWVGNGCWSGAATNDGGQRSFTLSMDWELLKCQLSVAEVNDPGEWTHIEAEGRIYAWIPGGENPNDHEMLSSCKPAVLFSSIDQDHVMLYGLDLRMGKQGTVLFTYSGATDSVMIVHCNISHVGHDYGENPAVIMSRAKNLGGDVHRFVTHTIIRACSISTARGTSASYYEHAGSGIEMYCAKYTLVDSCWVHDLEGNGIMWKNQNMMNNDSLATGNTIRFTKLENIEEYGIAGGNNCYKDSVYGCTFMNIGEVAIDINHGGDIDYGRHFICNNTVYRSNSFFWSRYDQISNDSTSILKYNIMYDNGADYTFDYFNYWGRFDQNQFGYIVDSNMWYDPGTAFNGYCSGGARNWPGWQGCGNDVNGLNADPGFVNAAAGNFSRPAATQEMEMTYGGKRWTLWGAWQSDDPPPPPPPDSSDNMAINITPTVSGTYAGYNPAAITDGATDPKAGPSTTWASDQGTDAHWVVIDFGQTKTVESVRVYWAWNSFSSAWTCPQLFHVQRWNGSSYEDIAIVNTADTLSFITTADTVLAHPTGAVSSVSNDSCVTVVGFIPVATSRIRIYQPANMGPVHYPTIMWMTEIEVYSKDIVPPVIDSPDLGAIPGTRNGEIELAWMAPGDNGVYGRASYYVIKYSQQPFTSIDWPVLPSYARPPWPKWSGEQENLVMTGLEPGQTYFVALKAYDERGNASIMSPIASAEAFKSKFAQDDEDAAQFGLVTPGDRTTLHSSRPILTATNLDDTPTNRYVFEISRDPGFTDVVAFSLPVYQQDGATTSWQVEHGLNPGDSYHWRVFVNNLYESEAWEFRLMPLPHAYPNPLDLSATDGATFTELPAFGDLVVMTVSGSPVRNWSDLSGTDIVWDGTNQNGQPVASGTYLWYIAGSEIGGKLVVIR